MKLFVAALIVFLLAFAGLAAGLLLRRRGIRSGCGQTESSGQNCRCESKLEADMQGRSNCQDE